MNFKAFVDNPVKVTMFFLALALMGYLSYRRLPLNLFPDIQTPRITIVATTKDLTPEDAERRLTTDFERQLATIKGVGSITSFSREKNIVIYIDFQWGQDMDFAYLDVKKNVGPLETNPNVTKIDVYRFDPNAAPLMTLAFSGNVDRVQATSFIDNTLKPRLETLKGVAYVKASGVSRPEVVLQADADAMTQLGIKPEAVIQAIEQRNISSTGGVIREGNEEMLLKFVSRFRTVEEIGNCVVAVIDRRPIHLNELGALRIRPEPDEVIVRQDGQRTVSLEIYREPDANAVETARLVRAFVAQLDTRGDFNLKVAQDQSREVEAAIGEVVNASFIGMGLAMLVLIFFLRNLYSTLVCGLAIPISIVATFCIMYFQGLSLNIMTLGGLALGAGMLVDNAIVVIENIFRHRQEGALPRQAAIDGTREVAMAISAASMTTIVVFVPLVFVHGIAAILFRDQALTVVYSLVISLVVALVLIPMLAARGRDRGVSGGGWMNRAYGGFLGLTLRVRWLLPAAFVVMMIWSWGLVQRVPTEFFPESVNGRISMQFALPSGTSLDVTEMAASRLERIVLAMRYRDPALAPALELYEREGLSDRFFDEARPILASILRAAPQQPHAMALLPLLYPSRLPRPPFAWARADPEAAAKAIQLQHAAEALDGEILVRSVTTVIGAEADSIEEADETIHGSHTGRLDVTLNPDFLRQVGAGDVIAMLRAEAARIPDLEYTFEAKDEFLQQLLGRNRGDVVVEVHADDVPDLEAVSSAAEREFRAIPGLANVHTNLVLGEEQYILKPDMDAILRRGFQIADLTAQIQSYLKGERSDALKLDRGEMAISVESDRAERVGLEGLLNLRILAADGTWDQLQNLVAVSRERGLRELMRVNQERTVLVMADLAGLRYADAIGAVRTRLDAMAWPGHGGGWNVSGEEVKRRDSFDRLLFALLIATVLVYMVIAAILESIIHPLTIMLSVPFALTGVVLAFLWSGVSLNLMGMIGIVMLVGIVVNNAIVLLDRVHQLRAEGRSAAAAVILAGRQRLRPILMTSLTTILALVPLALGFGNGAELRRPMAVAVIGGMVSSTLLTLWIMPAIYICVEDVLGVLRRPWRGGAAAAPPPAPEPAKAEG